MKERLKIEEVLEKKDIDLEVLKKVRLKDLFSFKINMYEFVFDLFLALYLAVLPVEKIIQGIKGSNILIAVLKVLIVTIICYLYTKFLKDITTIILASDNSISNNKYLKVLKKKELKLSVDKTGMISTNSKVINTTKSYLV